MKRIASLLCVLLYALAALAQERKEITANEVIERIKKHKTKVQPAIRVAHRTR